MKCLFCKKETNNPKFCSRSCSVSYNNRGVRRHGKPVKHCIHCEQELNRWARKYCSNKCQKVYEMKLRIESGNYSAKTAKKWLMIQDYSCAVCRIVNWNEKTLILEIDHIDGNAENNNLDNLRLLCPNCHSQTNTYKNKNKGNGRFLRRKRYSENKSF